MKTLKQFLNTLANYLMFKQEFVEQPETNAAHIITPITCDRCGIELIPVSATTEPVGHNPESAIKRGAHHRHPKGKSCRPRKAKAAGAASANEVREAVDGAGN